MTKHEIFAQFFTNLLTMDNRQQAQEIARSVWPATSDMWIHPMKIDPVLMELDLARVMDDGRIGYLVIDDSLGWRNDRWEIEMPTIEQRAEVRALTDHLLRQNLVMVLSDIGKTSWDQIKGIARRQTARFRVDGDLNEIEFHMGPDIFENSTRMAWTTPEEREDPRNKFQDRRVRSSDPDDFLSTIRDVVRFFPDEEAP